MVINEVVCNSCRHQFMPQDYWELTKDIVQEVECPKCGDPVRFTWTEIVNVVFKNAD